MAERLDKIIANRFAVSRKQAKTDIKAGLVFVDGKVCLDAEQKINDGQAVSYGNRALQHSKKRYIMLNKPQGVLTATKDTSRTTVIDLLDEELFEKGLFPVGRLDKDTTGLLLITNDGEWGHRLVNPKHHVKKVYLVTLDNIADQNVKNGFEQGVVLADKTVCKPAELHFTSDPYTVRVVLREGKYHQIKRMFGVFGLGVNALHRESVGNLILDPSLPTGKARFLIPAQILSAEEK